MGCVGLVHYVKGKDMQFIALTILAKAENESTNSGQRQYVGLAMERVAIQLETAPNVVELGLIWKS